LSDLGRYIESVKITIICHGNIARSQVLYHYLAEYAGRSALDIDLFSCGTAPIDAYPDVDLLLDEVQTELRKRGLNNPVRRNILDKEALQHLLGSDLILVADRSRGQEVLSLLGDQAEPKKVMLFYEYIGEGQNDFTDTYDTNKGAQDPERFSSCFNELERIARATIEQIQKTM
jgi:protein-tyrosine-phosphatase